MATTSTRNIVITYTGDVQASNNFPAANNVASPGDIDIIDLASGPNTITPPNFGGALPKACTIIMPTGNIIVVTLKGVAGDTGVALHLTDPSTIALNSPSATFVLSAASTLSGVRLVWS